MTTRIRRSFIAVLAATAVTASMGVGGAEAAKSCKVDGFKITKRKNVTCKKAKEVTKRKVSGQTLPAGWKCTDGKTVIPGGKCSKTGTDKSFKYEYAS